MKGQRGRREGWITAVCRCRRPAAPPNDGGASPKEPQYLMNLSVWDRKDSRRFRNTWQDKIYDNGWLCHERIMVRQCWDSLVECLQDTFLSEKISKTVWLWDIKYGGLGVAALKIEFYKLIMIVFESAAGCVRRRRLTIHLYRVGSKVLENHSFSCHKREWYLMTSFSILCHQASFEAVRQDSVGGC